MKISILISTYNGEQDIRPLLDSIEELKTGTHEIEVILRDDSSSDETADIVDREYGWVDLIRGEGGNVGFVQSNNIAFQKATGEVICCVNQDTILHQCFIVAGVKVLQTDPEVVGINTNMIMPWVMSLDEFGKKTQQELPAYEYQLTPFGFVRYIEVEKTVHDANFMTGGAFFVRRDVLGQRGFLFDPKIDMYCEDTELSLYLKLLGGQLNYCPLSIIYHNQVTRKAGTLRELVQFLKITRNRFSLFARVNDPIIFVLNYPLYLLGIIFKMSYLGLSFPKSILAYAAGTGGALLFICLFPYWLIYALRGDSRQQS